VQLRVPQVLARSGQVTLELAGVELSAERALVPRPGLTSGGLADPTAGATLSRPDPALEPVDTLLSRRNPRSRLADLRGTQRSPAGLPFAQAPQDEPSAPL
jgi:hypothetical protein